MKALVFDCETTGLILNHTVRRELWPEVIEFASCLIDWDTGEKLETFSTLIKPAKAVSAEITKITKIDNAMLADQSPFADLASEIKSRIEQADLAIAHNASFDVEMIDMEYDRLGQKLVWPRILCTVEQTVSLKGFRMNLGLIHEHLFGLEHEDAHRADTDVRALTRCVVEMRRREWL
jgi:DNA polymerase III alpha subunit (gram-positive type)